MERRLPPTKQQTGNLLSSSSPGTKHLYMWLHQQPQQQATKTSGNTRGQQPKYKGQQSYTLKYTCPGCSEAHYAFSCKLFKEKPVAQRKEWVRTHSLCTNCLKPGHSQADCRSKLSCQVCEGLHNTLIHSEQGGSSAAPSSGTVNVTSTSAANDSLHQNKLMMTCEALATGPTGKSMPVRALLDSGADISSITTRVANHLQLKHSGSQVAVATFGSPTEQVCPATHFTLSSFNKEGWKLPVAAVIIKKITDDQPRQDASLVKQMPVVQGLSPADPKFHLPGRVDVLLGADVLPYI